MGRHHRYLDGAGAVADAPRYPGGPFPALSSADAGQAGAFSPQPEGGSAAGKWFANEGELQRAFDHWRTVYNLERPHEALDMAVPGSRYQPSAREYSGNTTPPDYDEGVMVRKVDISGKLSVKGVSLSAGKAFRENGSG